MPELGYFHTDRPHPRGELLVKTQNMFAGYYKRPEVTGGVYDEDGYYCTGDIFTEIAPGQFQFTDRRNNVIKLSQGEFVAVSKVEAVLGDSPLVSQVYIYGNSARPYLLAVVVPTEDALVQPRRRRAHAADRPVAARRREESGPAVPMRCRAISSSRQAPFTR